ncbi:phosphotransferase [Nesterenkonia sandarakina]|uniref:Phosphotransferase family enzyme n=1 Tax=Nesterenkonia sandarakina TaxID=272918 RepID=A0A2T0YGQ1_9MICC|nr:phosphotransferase [Nesterenkonia sandarakina]PRZ14175.1 phosphotransferase family enzyme [Nesterenkonia sandarakina]
MDLHQVPGELVGVLRGPEAETLLRQSLEASGVVLRSWELEQIYARPGAELSARYRVRCTAPGVPTVAVGSAGSTDHAELTEPTELTMVASTVALTPQQRESMGAVRADSPHGAVHLWVHPVDPELPGLLVVERAARSAGEEPGARQPPGPVERAESAELPESRGLPENTERPDSTGLEARLSRLLGQPCRVQDLQMLVLRPLRRAVYRATLTSARGQRVLYLKVVRPARAAQLLRRHRCSPLIPASADAGDGILVLDQAPGLALTHHLHGAVAPADVGPIDPAVLLAALDTLHPKTLQMPPRVPPTQRPDGLAESAVAAGADPFRVQRLRERIGLSLQAAPGPLVPTHGDFHPANLFLDATARHPTGLIDADTVGPGFRVDDLATMLGHLLVLPSFDPSGYAAVPEFTRRFHAHCLDHADPADLGARTAAVLLSLLPGVPSAAQREHLLSCAETLAQRAGPADLD